MICSGKVMEMGRDTALVMPSKDWSDLGIQVGDRLEFLPTPDGFILKKVQPQAPNVPEQLSQLARQDEETRRRVEE